MAGGTLSIKPVVAPKTLKEWQLHLGQIAEDFANRKRDYKEATGQGKLAMATAELHYAGLRQVKVEQEIGRKVDLISAA